MNKHRQVFVFIVFVLLMLAGCNRTRSFYLEGVSAELAQYRVKHISEIHYELWFNISENQEEPVTGKVIIYFKQLKSLHGVNLDFQAGAGNIHEVKVNESVSEYSYLNQHILIPSDYIVPGKNTIEIAFTSSNQALNRADDFMYTLFVPDRASTAFPCFDQPDMKATFGLTLNIPEAWLAINNGLLVEEQVESGRKKLRFLLKHPISTYLFAFTAGKFQSTTQTEKGRSITMLHRETNGDKLNANAESIFSQHFKSLDWLASYTGIPYPFEKFDIAVLPGFQYSGMEHPGAIWYRDERLILDENAPLMQQLRKANLIAHETAHQWFGNFVSIKWFDDVWLKEVFAGFMADKMIAPQFPEINHDLQFVLSHFPRAYSIDRSPGTHPIKQELENMNMAGTLYGPIIYNKAPIIFRQLEEIMQPEYFRDAVCEYLQKYAHGNAGWNDLVTIFDGHCDKNISDWSKAWVYGKGMPFIVYEIENQNKTKLKTLKLSQINNPQMVPFPAQMLRVNLTYSLANFKQDVWFNMPELEIPLSEPKRQPMMVMLNGEGMGYGYFAPKKEDKSFIIQNLEKINDESLRAAVFLNLHEDFLNAGIIHDDYTNLLLVALHNETNPQLLSFICANLLTVIQNFLDAEKHSKLLTEAESLLWYKLITAPVESKQVFLDAWLAISRSAESLNNMFELYNKTFEIPGFPISEPNLTNLACEIALRSENGKEILEKELERIINPDRKKRLAFIIPALSNSQQERDDFFESIKKPENRNPEPWVLDALKYLHHPLRGQSSIKYIGESLAMLEEIQRTGDIFFPKNWLDAILGNYKSVEVAEIVKNFLETHKNLPENLKLKVYQSSDLLFRSSKNTGL